MSMNVSHESHLSDDKFQGNEDTPVDQHLPNLETMSDSSRLPRKHSAEMHPDKYSPPPDEPPHDEHPRGEQFSNDKCIPDGKYQSPEYPRSESQAVDEVLSDKHPPIKQLLSEPHTDGRLPDERLRQSDKNSPSEYLSNEVPIPSEHMSNGDPTNEHSLG